MKVNVSLSSTIQNFVQEYIGGVEDDREKVACEESSAEVKKNVVDWLRSCQEFQDRIFAERVPRVDFMTSVLHKTLSKDTFLFKARTDNKYLYLSSMTSRLKTLIRSKK